MRGSNLNRLFFKSDPISNEKGLSPQKSIWFYKMNFFVTVKTIGTIQNQIMRINFGAIIARGRVKFCDKHHSHLYPFFKLMKRSLCFVLSLWVLQIQYCHSTHRIENIDDGRLPLKNKTFVVVIKGKIGQGPFWWWNRNTLDSFLSPRHTVRTLNTWGVVGH